MYTVRPPLLYKLQRNYYILETTNHACICNLHAKYMYVDICIIADKVKHVYSDHPKDHQGDLLAQVKIHAIDSIWTLPPGCYREVTCLYSDCYIQVPLSCKITT